MPFLYNTFVSEFVQLSLWKKIQQLREKTESQLEDAQVTDCMQRMYFHKY